MGHLSFDLLVILVLILISSFLNCSEIAIIAVRRTLIKHLAEEGDKNAIIIHGFHKDMERFLASVQIGLTVIGATAAAIAGVISVEVLKPIFQAIPSEVVQNISEGLSVAVVVILVSYFTLTLGELLPKSLALRYPEKIALAVAKPISILSKILLPLARVLTHSSRFVLKPFKISRNIIENAQGSEEEIKLMLKEGREQGLIDQTEQELIHSVFEFTDISVKEVMVPRPKIHALSMDTSEEELLKYAAENKFSRYPVYKNGINDIVGLLNYKKIFESLATKQPLVLRTMLHPAYFVPETMKVSHLLKELQRRRMQMAIVINEYGTVEGLVTMEDLIEEIVGEIRDEYDTEEKPVERLKDGSLVIDASLSVRDLNADYRLPIPESGEYETLGGFVLSQLQNMPRGGEIIQSGEYKYTIVDMDLRRIAKVKVEKIKNLLEKPESLKVSS
ncbi:MAG: HlyC/CorC family transporter [Nitrospirae bacterium]|nr:HlyC/CorC family transporter [Nitrospirota bacterium]MBI3604594.1 HlyC/CorC family transporter [Nitrospirota bacterium]